MNIFEDTLKVTEVDPDGKRFDRVSRAVCETVGSQPVSVVFDYHSQLFPLKCGDKVKVSMYLENAANPVDDSRAEYATNSIIFKFEQCKEVVSVYMSAGGLLTSLKTESSKIPEIVSGSKVITLFSKVK